MGLERPKREELPALQEPEGSRLLTVRSVPLLLSQLLSPVWLLPAAAPKEGLRKTLSMASWRKHSVHRHCSIPTAGHTLSMWSTYK